MSIRLATLDDVPAILAMAEHFVGESGYGVAFCRSHSIDYLSMLLSHPQAMVLVSDDVKAGTIVKVMQDWCAQPVGYVEKLFLMPEVRGSGIARSLVSGALEFAKQNDCSHVFASPSAMMGTNVEKLFSNLFRKFGFSDCGNVLVRDMR